MGGVPPGGSGSYATSDDADDQSNEVKLTADRLTSAGFDERYYMNYDGTFL
jgi:hypothetical protein